MVNSKENETRPRNRRQNAPREKWSERVIQISRVTKVCKGGKKLSFRAVVVIGNENGQVGVGVGKESAGRRTSRQSKSRKKVARIRGEIVDERER